MPCKLRTGTLAQGVDPQGCWNCTHPVGRALADSRCVRRCRRNQAAARTKLSGRRLRVTPKDGDPRASYALLTEQLRELTGRDVPVHYEKMFSAADGEAMLRRLHPEEFDAYTSRVRRWFGRRAVKA